MATMRRTAVLAGLAACAAAAARLRRRGDASGAAGTIPAAADLPVPEPDHRESAEPQPLNYDAAGPVANTATHVPAPDPQTYEAIDEEAEIAAAAAEAANIGGARPEYPGPGLSEDADDAWRAVEEAGGGEAEGQELAEYELVESAQPSDTMSDAQRQIEDAIAAQGDPHRGETPEPLASHAREPVAEAEQAARDAGAGGGPSPGGDPASPAPDDPGGETWSGRGGGA